MKLPVYGTESITGTLVRAKSYTTGGLTAEFKARHGELVPKGNRTIIVVTVVDAFELPHTFITTYGSKRLDRLMLAIGEQIEICVAGQTVIPARLSSDPGLFGFDTQIVEGTAETSEGLVAGGFEQQAIVTDTEPPCQKEETNDEQIPVLP